MEMKYYERFVTRREKIPKSGKTAFFLYNEFFRSADLEWIEKQNRRVRKKFKETLPAEKFMRIPPNVVSQVKISPVA